MYNQRDKAAKPEGARGGRLAAVGGKERRTNSKANTNAYRTAAPPKSRTSVQDSRNLPLEKVMETNAEAMAVLRNGDSHRSNALLKQALAACEVGMAKAEMEGKQMKRLPQKQRNDSVVAESKKAHEAWLLVYSVTLSNLGCQLRRDNKASEALKCLCDARDVETKLCGKPSCSTMMNLSAVLLGMGDVEQALPIAKDCVLASQDGDRILFITALHNLAVTLGQQPSERERSAALPTMLRALRESQEFLGEEDPTTLMLKDKCSNTHRWIAPPEQFVKPRPRSQPDPLAFDKEGNEQQQPQQSASGYPSLKHSEVFLRRSISRKSTSIHHLPPIDESGAITASEASPQGAVPPPLSNEEAEAAAAQKSATEEEEAARYGQAVDNTAMGLTYDDEKYASPISTGVVEGTTRDDTVLHGTEMGVVVEEEEQHEPSETPKHAMGCIIDLVCHESSSIHSGHGVQMKAEGSGVSEYELQDLKAAEEQLHEHAAHAATEEKEAEKKEEAPAGTAAQASKSQAARYINMYDPNQPSFLRFAAVEDTVAPPAHLTYDLIRQRLRRELGPPAEKPKPAVNRSARSNASSVSREGGTTTSMNLAAEPAVAASVLKVDHSKRQAVLDAQRKEEELFRERRDKEMELLRAETEFQTALNRIVDRTRERAAIRIQEVWRTWWKRVGKPRRALQLKLAAERERRLRERLAALADPNNPLSQKGIKAAWKLDNRAPPEVIVRCGRTWLKQTSCLRYLARNKLPHNDKSEADVFKQISKIQATWRGVMGRRQVAQLREARDIMLEEYLRPMEEADYAAILIQKMWRGRKARETRATLYVTRYTPPVVTIQNWFRTVIASQRARCVDTTTVNKRNRAAATIQKAWFAYQKRIGHYMAKLREQIEFLRTSEKLSAITLQSVGRGFLVRNSCRKYRQFCIEAQREHKLEQQRRDHELAEERRKAELEAQRAIVVPRTEYERECLERAPEIYQKMYADHDEYHVPLYSNVMAERERKAWATAIELRPFDIQLRRAGEDLRCMKEVNTMRRARAASKIQREFRSWLAHKKNPNRDTSLLRISQGKYQQREYERDLVRMQYRRQQEKAISIYGDQAKEMREMAKEARMELDELQSTMPTYVQPRHVRTRKQRLADEKALARDECIISHSYPDALVRLREDLDEMKARTGTVVEHPYYKCHPCDKYRRALDID